MNHDAYILLANFLTAIVNLVITYILYSYTVFKGYRYFCKLDINLGEYLLGNGQESYINRNLTLLCLCEGTRRFIYLLTHTFIISYRWQWKLYW